MNETTGDADRTRPARVVRGVQDDREPDQVFADMQRARKAAAAERAAEQAELDAIVAEEFGIAPKGNGKGKRQKVLLTQKDVRAAKQLANAAAAVGAPIADQLAQEAADLEAIWNADKLLHPRGGGSKQKKRQQRVRDLQRMHDQQGGNVNRTRKRIASADEIDMYLANLAVNGIAASVVAPRPDGSDTPLGRPVPRFTRIALAGDIYKSAKSGPAPIEPSVERRWRSIKHTRGFAPAGGDRSGNLDSAECRHADQRNGKKCFDPRNDKSPFFARFVRRHVDDVDVSAWSEGSAKRRHASSRLNSPRGRKMLFDGPDGDVFMATFDSCSRRTFRRVRGYQADLNRRVRRDRSESRVEMSAEDAALLTWLKKMGHPIPAELADMKKPRKRAATTAIAARKAKREVANEDDLIARALEIASAR